MNNIFYVALILGTAILAFGQRDTIKVYKINTWSIMGIPVMDGNLSDWDDLYKIFKPWEATSLNNIFFIGGTNDSGWTGFHSDYNADVYAAHDGTYFYLGWRCTADDVVLSGSPTRRLCDNIRIGMGAKDDWIELFNAPLSDSNPRFGSAYTYPVVCGVTIGTGGASLPSYEISIPILEFRIPPSPPKFITLMSLGTEDYDGGNGSNDAYLGVKVKYTGTKHDTIDNPWDSLANYPIVQFLDKDTSIPVCCGKIESSITAGKSEVLVMASPNPFNPSTTISYAIKGAGALKIYNIDGKQITCYSGLRNRGKIAWNGTDATGNLVAAGVYIAHLVSGGKVYTAKLAYAK